MEKNDRGRGRYSVERIVENGLLKLGIFCGV